MWMHLSAREPSLGPHQYTSNNKQAILSYILLKKKWTRCPDCRGSVCEGGVSRRLRIIWSETPPQGRTPPYIGRKGGGKKRKEKKWKENCDEKVTVGEPQRFIAIAGSGCGIRSGRGQKRLRRQGGRKSLGRMTGLGFTQSQSKNLRAKKKIRAVV